VLLDYVDVVVHVQHSEERTLYSLDRLWKDCPPIELGELEPGGASELEPSGASE
jgi:ribosome-associated protein